MINFKQEQLIESLVNHVREKFPEVSFIGVTESPEDPESLWIRVTAPEDENRESELIEYSAGLRLSYAGYADRESALCLSIYGTTCTETWVERGEAGLKTKPFFPRSQAPAWERETTPLPLNSAFFQKNNKKFA